MNDKERLEEEFGFCQECGKELNLENEFHRSFGTCDVNCHMKLVGMSWTDFI